jgi:hypothetical protein
MKTRITLLTAGLLLSATTVFSQLRVINTQKISNASGGLGLTLTAENHFGLYVNSIGDFDKDGVTDIAVSANGDNDGGAGNGAFYILLMKSDGTVKSKHKISETSGNLGVTFPSGGTEAFGFAINNMGDIDGDGVPDLAVGAMGENNFTGAVYILFMKSDATVKSVQVLNSSTSGLTGLSTSWFGCDVANAGDLNSDGINDLAVGAINENGLMGATYIILLNSNGTPKSVKRISSGTNGFPGVLVAKDRFGVSVSGIGDVDGDGIPDLAVGAHGDNEVNSEAGAVYILKMNNDGTVKSVNKINTKARSIAANSGVFFGCSVAGCPDMNGDGIRDLLVGSFYDNDGGKERGAYYVVFLDKNSNSTGYQKFSSTSGISGLHNQDHFGCGIDFVSSPSTDEYTIVSGASLDDDEETNSGAVYMVTMKNHTVTSLADYAKNEAGIKVYPNPFSQTLGIRYELESSDMVSVRIHDITGNTVYQIPTENEISGIHQITLDNLNLNSGIYFLTIAKGNTVNTVKLIKE